MVVVLFAGKGDEVGVLEVKKVAVLKFLMLLATGTGGKRLRLRKGVSRRVCESRAASPEVTFGPRIVSIDFAKR